MNTASTDIKDLLVEEDLGLAFATNLFIGKEPVNPANCVTIFDASGGRPMLSYKKGENYYYPDIQIRVRNNSYDEAMKLAQDISIKLHGRGNEVINETYYSVIQAIDDPFLLDWDENNRARVIVNFGLQRRRENV